MTLQSASFFKKYISIQHERNQTTGEYSFQCQFGPEECIGNKIHACSIKYVDDPHNLADYFNDIIDYTEEVPEVAAEVWVF